jgi:hypothetical protein
MRITLLVVAFVFLTIGFSFLLVADEVALNGKVVINGEWGSGSEEFGFFKHDDIMPNGPSSFAIDKEGNFYINDCVNNRIQIFNSSGKFIRTVSLDKILPKPNKGTYGDVAVSGEAIFLSAANKVYSFDIEGNLIDKVDVYEAGKIIAGEDNSVYVHLITGEGWVKIKDGKKVEKVEASDLVILNNKKVIRKNEQKTRGEKKNFAISVNGESVSISKKISGERVIDVSSAYIPFSSYFIGSSSKGYFYLTSMFKFWKINEVG